MVISVNCMGLKCPQPILKIAAKSTDVSPGDVLEAVADCPTFEQDVRQWCERAGKTLLWVRSEGGGKWRCHIQF